MLKYLRSDSLIINDSLAECVNGMFQWIGSHLWKYEKSLWMFGWLRCQSSPFIASSSRSMSWKSYRHPRYIDLWYFRSKFTSNITFVALIVLYFPEILSKKRRMSHGASHFRRFVSFDTNCQTFCVDKFKINLLIAICHLVNFKATTKSICLTRYSTDKIQRHAITQLLLFFISFTHSDR